jgi:hypothetical protein
LPQQDDKESDTKSKWANRRTIKLSLGTKNPKSDRQITRSFLFSPKRIAINLLNFFPATIRELVSLN